MKVKEDKRLMSEVRRWEEERRHVKTKETMQNCLKSPNGYTLKTINSMNTKQKYQTKKKKKEHWVCQVICETFKIISKGENRCYIF